MTTPLDIIMQIFGYLGALGVAIVSLPELINLIKTKKTYHINYVLFIILFLASVFFLISGYYNFAVDPDVVAHKNIGNGAIFGLTVAIANTFSGCISGIILTVKTIHKIKAKKMNLSEEEYYNKVIKKNKE